MGHQLNFSRSKLLSHGLVALLGGTASCALALGTSDRDVAHFGLLRLLGPAGARCFLIGAGILCLLLVLGLLRRMIGDGLAAAIRDEGIQFNSLFVSRFIPWRDLERVRLHEWRSSRGRRFHAIRAEASSGAHSISTRIVEATDAEIAGWIKEAGEARVRALTRPAALTRAHPGRSIKPGFGRRPI
jgi:hypothetical protein